MIAFLKFCNAFFRITVSTFSAALSAVLASQSPISIFDSPSRLSKVLWGYWRRFAPKVNSAAAQRSMLPGHKGQHDAPASFPTLSGSSRKGVDR